MPVGNADRLPVNRENAAPVMESEPNAVLCRKVGGLLSDEIAEVGHERR